MLVFIGDIHGEFHILNKLLSKVPENATVIQVGDFGLWPVVGEHYHQIYPEPIKKVYWIDGNHEYFPTIQPHMNPPVGAGWSGVVEIKPSCAYIPRGTVLELDGMTVGFLGGADSIDKQWRREHIDWFREERIRQQDIERLVANAEAAGGIDLLVTHTPPALIVERMLQGETIYPEFHYSARYLQIVWDTLGRPPVISGHMHPEHEFDYLNAKVLPVNGVYVLDV